MFGRRCRIPAGLLRIQSDPTGSWPNSAGSMTGSVQIRPDPGHFGQISGWIRPDPAVSRPFWPDPVRSCRILSILARSGRILTMVEFRPESGLLASGYGGQMSPNFGAGSIPVAECYQISKPLGFRLPTMAGFRQSNIKRVCKDEEYNFGK
jgi:hypothetical protein